MWFYSPLLPPPMAFSRYPAERDQQLGRRDPPKSGSSESHVLKSSSQDLEAQQRYFSYRAILAAIVSQNYFVLVFVGYRTIIERYVAKWGIAQMCLCETKYQGGGIAPFWGSANLPEKVSRDMGYRSDSIAISRDMGPLSLRN